MSFPKQYPVLTATLGFLGALCVAGAGASVWQYLKYSETQKTLGETRSNLDAARTFKYKPPSASSQEGKRLAELRGFLKKTVVQNDLQNLSKEFTPDEANLAAVTANRDAFATIAKKLFADLDLRATRDRLFEAEEPSSTRSGADLVAKLKEVDQRLRERLKEAKVRIYTRTTGVNDFGFGFSRYVNSSDGIQPQSRFKDLLVQQRIIDHLVTKLAEAKNDKTLIPGQPVPKDSDSPLILQSVQREPIEVAAGTAGNRGASTDEYTPRAEETLRRRDVTTSYFFRVTFTAKTDVLRRFVNSVRYEKTPLVFRGLVVEPANPTVLEPPADPNAPAAATPAAAAAAPVDPFAIPATTAPAAGDAAAPALPGTAAPAPAAAGATGFAGAAPAAGTPDKLEIVPDAPSEFTVSFEYLTPTPATAGESPAK
ncbi:MAG: Amuc_1100 family pilus-like protein [Puniceicoccales bacterium]|jgi:hypothetical protein|nr:Amuc_1100 family pilus-like protein [Puniceicoccales bacterium]